MAQFGWLLCNFLFGMCLMLSSASAAPAVTNTFPTAGRTVRSLGQFEVFFNQPVQGVEAADLLVGGAPATNLIVKAGGALTFQFAPRATGAVAITWAAGAGIIDYSAVPVAFPATNVWNLTVNPSLTYPDLAITELCAGNRSGLTDENGLAADWLEIHNRGATTADLMDWSLSDDPTLPSQWVFPARVLNPGERIVVFASGKDIRGPSGTNRFHLNFTLSAGGEFLGLFTPESPRVVQSGWDFPEQRNDYSWGPDANGSLRYFAAPTPGTANPASSLTNLAQPVHFSVQRGFFTLPFDLVLSTPTPGATIRYTTDGAEPVEGSGLVYSTPLRISTSAVVRAVAFAPDAAPSVVRTHTYLFNASAAIRSLPVLSIVTSTNNLVGSNGITGISVSNYVGGVWTALSPSDYNNNTNHGIVWERPVSAEYILATDNSGFQIDCGLRVQGSDYTRPRYTWTSKFGYRLYFRGDYGTSKLTYPLFPTSALQNFDGIVLRAGHNDISNPFIKDELSRRLHSDMGHAAAQGTFVNLFLNGTYKGYYNPAERVDEDSLQPWEGGGTDWDRITVNSVVQGGDNASWTELRNIFSTGQNLQTPSIYQDLAHRLDLVNFVDYLLLEIYGANWDWLNNNWRAGRERVPSGIWRYYTWDLEAAFDTGQRLPTVDVWTTTNRLALGNSTTEISIFQRGLTNSAEYRLLFADRIQKHFFNGGALTDQHITNRFYEMKSVMAGVIPSMNMLIVTNWVPNRRAPLFSQFLQYGLYTSNAPVFNQHGGNVARGFNLTMSAPLGGTIYYTTNGDDPRVAFTGAIASSARSYSAAEVLDASRTVKARTINGGNWSPLSEAAFSVATLGVPLRITEINYNPPGGSTYEFVEIQNIGSLPFDLTGFVFDEGISYWFPQNSVLAPGAALVLANNNNPALFAARYPGVTVFGYFTGNLNNGGERLALKDAAGNVMASVDYNNKSGWPTAPDGTGPSLEIIDPLGSPDDPANWRASAANYGTPGVVTPPPAVPLVRLNEIMAENRSAVSNAGAFPDWIELHNAGPTDADLTDWSLSDDGNARKFVFPTATTLPAGGYLVVWCDTNASPGLHTGFGLDAQGDNVYLFNASTSRVDAISFGPQVPDLTLGRIGGAWTLTVPTTNAANVVAPLGSATNLVINEWLANPPAGQPDWIELHNRASLPVALRDLYVGTSNSVQLLSSLSFVPPGGFVQLFADGGTGPAHLELKLPATGGTISLYDALASQVDRVTYTAQTEGVSRGRLPDGTATFVNFTGTASPGASNYVNIYAGAVFNEVLARNLAAASSGFVELFNPGATDFDLGGMSLSVNRAETGQWIFPAGTVLAPSGFLVVWCDPARPPLTTPGDFNLGRAVDGESGAAYLFNTSGQLATSVEFGPQITDLSIGLSGGQWRLLTAPTPGTANAAPATLGTNSFLRLNEWMAGATNGPDWFELFNATNRPVELSQLYLTDDPSTVGLTRFRIPPLSFIGANGWARFVADNDPEQGRHHVNFNLSAEGEQLWLVQTNGTNLTVLESVSFATQTPGVSQGRYPDGTAGIFSFYGSASPGAANNFDSPPQLIVGLTNLAVRLGSRVVLNVTAVGRMPLDYRWFFQGELVPEATTNNFIIPSAALSNEGPYQVVISNSLGSVTSDVATLAVLVPPNIVTQPVDVTVSPGSPAAFSVVATSTLPLGYRWLFQGQPLAGATNDHLSFASAALSNDGAYQVVVSNAADSITSSVAMLTVLAPLAVTNQPQSISAWPYTNISFAVGVTGSRTIRYQWRCNGTNLPNATNATLVKPSVLPSDAGTYSVAITNTVSGLTSTSAVLNVFTNPLILTQPLGRSAMPGSNATFAVTATSSSPLRYQWLFNTTNTLVGATNDTYSLTNVTTNQYGFYNVRVYDNFGSTLSDAAQLADKLKPTIVQQPSPTNTVLLVGTPLTFSASAIGPMPISFRWRRGGATLTNAIQYENNSSYSIPGGILPNLGAPFTNLSASFTNAGRYDVVVTNAAGNAPSSTYVYLTVLAPLTNQAARPGSNVTFSFVACSSWSNSANATMALRYQWWFNETNLLLSMTNPTAMTLTLTNVTLSLTNVQLAQEGTYKVVLTNNTGMSATQTATLTLLRPPTIVQQPTAPATAVLAGTDVSLEVSASGSAPLGYLWEHDGAPLTNVTGRSLLLSNVRAADAGGYCVIVTNSEGSVTSTVAVVTVQTYILSGQVEIENYVGPALSGCGSRVVTFTASDLVNEPIMSWDMALDFSPGPSHTGVASFSITGAPPTACYLSAKTAWHLRKLLPVVFTGFEATANFAEAYRLPIGDLDGSNYVDWDDYALLAGAWYTSDPAADLDGNGLVDILDYFLLASRWGWQGDPE